MSKISLQSLILDFVFPRACLVCGVQGQICCPDCFGEFRFSKLRCLACNAANPFGLYCTKCRRRYHPDLVITEFAFSGPVRDLIHQFKYQDAFEVGRLFGLSLARNLRRRRDWSGFVIAAIPLTKRRRKHRGYNQAEVIAKIIAKELELEYQDLLIRPESQSWLKAILGLGTSSQVKTHSREERRANVEGVFALNKSIEIAPKVILLDDVITTGATIEEATKVLKRAGAKEVVAVAVAG